MTLACGQEGRMLARDTAVYERELRQQDEGCISLDAASQVVW